MGESSKRHDLTKLGVHGEGLKLALLILQRENRNPAIKTNGRTFTCNFSSAVTHNIEVLVFIPSEYVYLTDENYTIITFECSSEEWDSLKTLVLPKDTPYGLLDKDVYPTSALYLGGLRISEVGFRYSYNLAPGAIKIERDRRVADIYQVQEAVAQIWVDTKDWDTIVDGMLKDYEDFKGMCAIELPQDLIDACVKRADEFAKPPISYSMSSAQYDGRYVSETFYKVYNQSTTARKAPARKQPADILADWFKTNRSYFRKAGAARMAELIKEAKKWNR